MWWSFCGAIMTQGGGLAVRVVWGYLLLTIAVESTVD